MFRNHHILREQATDGNIADAPSAEDISRLSQASSPELENTAVGDEVKLDENGNPIEDITPAVPEVKLDADGNPIEEAPIEPKLDKDGNPIVEDPAKSNTTDTYEPSKEWDMLKADEAFVMPEGITAENEKELLKTAVMAKFGIEDSTTDLHPLAKQIQDMSKENPEITINDLVSSVQEELIDIKGMSDDEVIAYDLKLRYGTYDEKTNPKGLNDTDIQEHIEKMTKVEKNEKVIEIEKDVNNYNQSKTLEYQEKNKVQYEKQYNDILEKNNEYVKGIENKTLNLKNIYGIPVNPELTKSYIEEFKLAITPDKETGIRGLDNMLSDDMLLFKLFVLAAHNGEEKVIEQITKGRETAKEEIFKKLNLTPTFSGHRESSDQTLSVEQEIELLTQSQK